MAFVETKLLICIAWAALLPVNVVINEVWLPITVLAAVMLAFNESVTAPTTLATLADMAAFTYALLAAPVILLTVNVTLPVSPLTRSTGATGMPDAETVAILPTIALAKVVTVK